MLCANSDNVTFGVSGNVLTIEAIPGKDFFVNPVDDSVVADAAFVYRPVVGDFVCRAKISLEHKAKFDGGALFAYQDDTHWVKACFEQGDYGFKSVVTVATDGVSDDCYGVTVHGDFVWLQLARTDDVFSIHYSFDGMQWFMSRLCSSMLFDRLLKVGFEAQSPTGDGGTRTFTDFEILDHRLSDPRAGQ